MNVFTFTEAMTRGQLPLNISTSLAIESLVDVHPELKWPTPPYKNYTEYWLNLRTLFRNIRSSFTSDLNVLMTPAVMAELMLDEWRAIGVALEDTRLRPVLYLCNYKELYRKYRNHTIFKSDRTAKQEAEREMMEKSIDQFLHDVGEGYVEIFDTQISPTNRADAIIQTHLVVDLLSWSKFDKLDLLESHTGAIKNRSLWYTKYNNGKDLSMIPFTQYFLRIFGDKEFFSPKDPALRKALIELGTRFNWGPLTTDAKIRMNLDMMKNPFFRDVVKDMM